MVKQAGVMLNAVLKSRLCDGSDAVVAFRWAQRVLTVENEGLGINLGGSFVVFMRAVLTYDRSWGM